MTVQELFREEVIINVRITNFISYQTIAAYDPDDYFNNIVADIYGNGYKIKHISVGNHCVVFFVEDAKKMKIEKEIKNE